MKQQVKRLLRDQSGAISILTIGILFVLLLVFLLLIEIGAAYESYDYALDVLQRAANSAVEGNINDACRADRILLLETDMAAEDFRSFVRDDFSDKYRINITSIDCTESPPSLTATGSGTFATVFSQFGFEDISFTFRVTSTNYDLDG